MNVYCLRHSVCSVLLWEPRLTSVLCKQEDSEDRARRIQKSNACPLHSFSKGSVPSKVQKQEGGGIVV